MYPYSLGPRHATREPNSVAPSPPAFWLCAAIQTQGIELRMNDHQLSLAHKVHLVLQLH